MPQTRPEQWTGKSLFRLFWPLVAEQLLGVTMGIADTVMVKTIGEFAVSGVSIVDVINNLFIIAFGALATGGAVVVSQYIGKGDKKRSALSAKQLVYVSAGAAAAALAVGVFLRRPILSLIYGAVEKEVARAAETYFFISALGYPCIALYNAAAALFRSMGNSKVPMLTALLVNILNIGGNALLIFGFRMGVAGAALSTLASRGLAAFILIALLLRGRYRRSPVSLSGLFKARIDVPILKSILYVGIPNGVENSMFQVGKIMVARIFTSFGIAATAANAIATSINSLSYMPGNAFGLGLLTVVGQCIGAGDNVAAKKYTARIMKWGYLVLIVINGSMLLFMNRIVGIFGLAPQTAQLLKSYLWIHCAAAPVFWAPAFILPNALRAAGDVRYCMVVSSITMWTIRITTAYILAYPLGIGPAAAWYAMGADFVVRGLCFTLRWTGGRWQGKKVIRE
ncbi:MAG: MATE family efflux transporter [Treponema sp.]|nr:MATE family efflux transporter [Treponema sp.]